jgi:hypothetical protein
MLGREAPCYGPHRRCLMRPRSLPGLTAAAVVLSSEHGFAKRKNQDFRFYATVAFMPAHLLN